MLADFLESSRRRAAEALRFVLENGRPRRKAAEVLTLAQHAYWRDRALEKAGLERAAWGTEREREANKLMRSRNASYTQRYRALPHGAWAQAIMRIRAEPDPMRALVRFHKLQADMKFLVVSVAEAAASLEARLQED